jgi:site-specific recombinase XerC
VKPATVSANFRALQQIFKWLVREEEIDRSPVDGAHGPIVQEQPVSVVEVGQLCAVIDSCKSNPFVGRGDQAIFRLLNYTGGRLGEIVGLMMDDVDFDAGIAHVLARADAATLLALRRYLRAQARDRRLALTQLWRAEKGKGALQANGIRLMIRRRVSPSASPACMLTNSGILRASLAVGGRRRDRPDADHGLEIAADAPPLRRQQSHQTSVFGRRPHIHRR